MQSLLFANGIVLSYGCGFHTVDERCR